MNWKIIESDDEQQMVGRSANPTLLPLEWIPGRPVQWHEVSATSELRIRSNIVEVLVLNQPTLAVPGDFYEAMVLRSHHPQLNYTGVTADPELKVLFGLVSRLQNVWRLMKCSVPGQRLGTVLNLMFSLEWFDPHFLEEPDSNLRGLFLGWHGWRTNGSSVFHKRDSRLLLFLDAPSPAGRNPNNL